LGNPTVFALVFVSCSAGSPNYLIDVFTGGTEHSRSAHAGDVLTMNIVQTANKVTATVKDTTQATITTVSGFPTPDNTLLWGAFPYFAQGQVAPVPDFGTAKIQRPVLDTELLSNWSPTKVLRQKGAITQIGVTTLGANTSTFKLLFKSH